MNQDSLRRIPKVDLLLSRAEGRPALAAAPPARLLSAVRGVLEDLRQALLSGRLDAVPAEDILLDEALARLKKEFAFSLRPAVNATGIVLHTNLGRAPLSEAAALWAARVASSYSTLEYDVESGGRGSRQLHLEGLLSRLTGGEAALAVNNNAAALLLIVSGLCAGREVIVSRGELVEIGGSFRLPEILREGGAILREVGATNRTSLADFARAVAPERSAGFLKVHTSNFRIIGYAGQPSVAELAALAAAQRLPLICDLGSGALGGTESLGLADEPSIAQVLAAGADLVCFSGDKLLGGAQAGLIVGRKDLVDRLKARPLARALRIDKFSLAALEATLRLHLEPERARREIPVLAMLSAAPKELKSRAARLKRVLAAALPDLSLETAEVKGLAGGGAAPERPFPSWAVAVSHPRLSAERLEALLRRHEPPIIARIRKERLLLDVRTLKTEHFAVIAKALAGAEPEAQGGLLLMNGEAEG